jgi:hypothetical protein
MQADGSQNQEHHLSRQIEATSIEKLSSATRELRSIDRLTAELMSSLSWLAAEQLIAQVVLSCCQL